MSGFVLAGAIVLLWVVVCAWWDHRGPKPVEPLVIPAILCATPHQWWLQRHAEIAGVPVRFEAAPYPPRGPGAGSPPPAPSRPSPTVAVLSMNERRRLTLLDEKEMFDRALAHTRDEMQRAIMSTFFHPPNPGRAVRQ